MSPESAATSIARIRIAIGVAAVAAPGLTARVVSGGRDASGTARLFARLFGGRDLALGLGTVIALDRGKPVRGWLEASALADVIDCTACSLGGEDMSPIILRIAAGFGAAAAFAGLFLSRRLDPPPPAHPGHPEAVWTGHGVSSSAR